MTLLTFSKIEFLFSSALPSLHLVCSCEMSVFISSETSFVKYFVDLIYCHFYQAVPSTSACRKTEGQCELLLSLHLIIIFTNFRGSSWCEA